MTRYWHYRISLSATVFLLIFPRCALVQNNITELSFNEPPGTGSDAARTLETLVKVQGRGGLCQDALYLITHAGNRDSLFEAENRRSLDSPWRNDTWRFCSEFATKTTTDVFMGRNWDNQNVGSIVVSLYHPPDGYASVSFARAIDMGYPLNVDLEQIKSADLANKLLLAPFFATDGINEHGLSVAVGGVREVKHDANNGKPRVFITYLIRKILDQNKTVDEAVTLARQYVPFDLDSASLNGHLIVADSTGRSVILEYDHDQWRTIYSDKPFQVLTNKVIYDAGDADLRERCWRYKGISETLDSTGGNIQWQDGLTILRDAAQQGTTWSVLYSPTRKDLHLSVYQKWDTVYHLSIP